MDKYYKALKRAEKDRKEQLLPVLRESKKAVIELPPQKDLRQLAPKWCEELRTKIQAQSPQSLIKTIMFTSTNHGEGSSTTAAGFATVMATNYEFKVLLIDINLRTPGLHRLFNIKQMQKLSDVFSGKYAQESILSAVRQKNLYVITCNGNFTGTPRLFESDKFDVFLKKMCDYFDYIVLDAPPVPIFPDVNIVSSRVDGVILILEAEKTRRQVALKAKTEIEDSGGKLLGVVLNKRKYYIPRWLYKRL